MAELELIFDFGESSLSVSRFAVREGVSVTPAGGPPPVRPRVTMVPLRPA